MQRALADGRLMRTFSFRGSVQVMAPETVGAYLALRSAGRQWARRTWVEQYQLAADDWPDLRAVVREVVADARLGRHPRPRRGRSVRRPGVRRRLRPHDPGPRAPRVGRRLERRAEGLEQWWREAQDSLVEVDVDGETRWHVAERSDELAGTHPEPTVVLLPGKDDRVMGPGTKDAWVVPAGLRTDMTRGANPVLVDGVVAGTWRVVGRALELRTR